MCPKPSSRVVLFTITMLAGLPSVLGNTALAQSAENLTCQVTTFEGGTTTETCCFSCASTVHIQLQRSFWWADCDNNECPESGTWNTYDIIDATIPFFRCSEWESDDNTVSWRGIVGLTEFTKGHFTLCLEQNDEGDELEVLVVFDGGSPTEDASWTVMAFYPPRANLDSYDNNWILPTWSQEQSGVDCAGGSWSWTDTNCQAGPLSGGACGFKHPVTCEDGCEYCQEGKKETYDFDISVTGVGSDPLDCDDLKDLVRNKCDLGESLTPADILELLYNTAGECGPSWTCETILLCLLDVLERGITEEEAGEVQDKIDEWFASSPCATGNGITNDANPDDIGIDDRDDKLVTSCADEEGELTESPIHVFSGSKAETTTDLSIPLVGSDFQIVRSYTSNPAYGGAGLVGVGWTLSCFDYIVPSYMIRISFGWQSPVEWRTGGSGVYFLSGGSEGLEETTLGGVDVYKETHDGEMIRYYYRNNGSGLSGMLYQEEDWYGNVRRYDYNTGYGKPRLESIFLGGTDDESSEAVIRFTWDLGHPKGRLLYMQLFRWDSTVLREVERVSYLYQADGVNDHLGSPGDLLQVTHRTMVDRVESGASDSIERITQYRYHREGVTPGSGDDRLEVEGGNHQLKLIIEPEQIEYIAQKRNEDSGGTLYPIVSKALKLTAADLLEAEDDDDVFSPSVGDPILLIDLASKIVGYYTTGLGQVKTQFLQTGGCGCSGASAQGLKQTYTHFTNGTNDEYHSVRILEELYDESVPEYATFRTLYYDAEGLRSSPTGPYTAPYLVNRAVVEPTGDERKWVWHYEYNTGTDRTLKFMMTPSAMSAYTPAGGSPASYTAHTDEGLVYAYTFADYRPEEVRVGEGKLSSTIGDYTLVSKTTYNSTREWLPDSIERFRVAGSTSADDVETTLFEYGFFSSTDRVAWTRVKTEAELLAENGPGISGGYYESYELYDTNGENFWSRSADHSLTKRTFDSATGRVASIVRNALQTQLPGWGGSGHAGLTYSGWSDQNADGGSTTTTYVYDLVGRQIERIAPGDISSYTVRETRSIESRPYMLYYAELTLPDKEGSEFNGDASIGWYDAGGNVIGTSSYGVSAIVTTPTLDYTLTSELSRSRTTHLLSGLVQQREDWHDLAQDPYITAYAYDDAGRLATTTDPIGKISENAAYDVLGRVLEVKVGQTGGSNVTVAEYFYDFDHGGSFGSPEQGLGNGNLTYVRQHVDGSTVRDTLRDFDFRDRPYRTLNEIAPHEFVVYDNLDRIIERGVFQDTPTGIGTPLSDRGLYVQTHYSQRGLGYRQSIATDPTSGSPEFLQTNSWFDPNGRTVVQWSPNSPIIKREFDGLGRSTASYVVRDATLYSYGPGRNSTPPIDDDGSLSPSLPYDIVLEQTEYEYTTGTDRLEFVTALRRVHDDTSTAGPLTYNGASSTALGVPSYVGHYYDAFNRRIRTVNIGTNDSTNDEFSAGTAAPSWPPAEVPEWDDVDFEDYLVSATEYDERGRPYLSTDPEGKQTRIFFDAMHRRIAVAENYVDADVTGWSSGNGRWTITGVGGSSGETDEDRVTSFVYDGAGNITKQIAHIPGGDLQETQYLYAAAPANLLSEVRYPNESTGVAGTTREYKVLYTYDRLGELASVEDQNETLHEYTRDDLGRVTLDDVTLAMSSPIDDWVLSIGVDYDDFGRLEKVTSYTTTAHSTVKNQAEFAYSPLWQIKEVYQDYDGAVAYDGSGVPTGNTLRVRYAYSTADYDSGNYSRLSTITYPDGTDYNQYYGTTSADLDDHISRLTRMRIGTSGANTVKYQHVGLGMVAEVDYPAPDIQLDRTVSHDGKRNNQGFTTQTSGVYPGWDRFGRVKKHAWVDGAYTTGTGSNPSVPPLVEIGYTYDRSSNRLTRTDARPGASWTDRDFKYTYDGLDRLVQADRGAQGGSWSAAVGGQQWALDMLGNWNSIFNDNDGDGNYTSSSPDEETERTHNFANEIEDIGILPFAYDAAGNMTEQGLPAATTKYYTHDAWNRLTEVKIGTTSLGQYEYNALHWRTVKRSLSQGAGSIDEMRLMYYSANWQLLEERIDRSWTSGFTEDERAQTFWGKRYIDDAVGRRRDRDANGTYDNNFFYVTDAQFSTVAMVNASNSRVVERVTYNSYGKARHHFGGDVTGDGAATAAGDDAALVTTIGLGSNSIGQVNYKAEQDLNRDGTISTADRTTLAALTGGADQAALASGLVSFVSTGSGGSTVHGPDNPIAWDGYIFSDETGQYLVRSRWYDPAFGRWIERDPMHTVEGSNLYMYCSSMPADVTDPYGLMSCCPGSVYSECQRLGRLLEEVRKEIARQNLMAGLLTLAAGGYDADPFIASGRVFLRFGEGMFMAINIAKGLVAFNDYAMAAMKITPAKFSRPWDCEEMLENFSIMDEALGRQLKLLNLITLDGALSTWGEAQLAQLGREKYELLLEAQRHMEIAATLLGTDQLYVQMMESVGCGDDPAAWMPHRLKQHPVDPLFRRSQPQIDPPPKEL